MRFGGWILLVWCAFAFAMLAPSSARAQACAPGRVVAPDTEGRCCWPGQTWSAADDRCAGVPVCPEGWGGDGPTCVPLHAVDTAAVDTAAFDDRAATEIVPDAPDATVSPPTLTASVAPATALADPRTPQDWERAAPLPPTLGPRRINFNVVGGGLALALSTYAGALAEAFIWGSCGAIAYFVPGGALVGAAQSAACGSSVAAATGIAFGLGQFIGVFLMVAGSTIFRRRGIPIAVDVSYGDLTIAF